MKKLLVMLFCLVAMRGYAQERSVDFSRYVDNYSLLGAASARNQDLPSLHQVQSCIFNEGQLDLARENVTLQDIDSIYSVQVEGSDVSLDLAEVKSALFMLWHAAYKEVLHKQDDSGVIDPLGDGISQVRLLHVMGSDLDVVNDARVSFDKQVSTLSKRDKRLIRYLIRHSHTSPLRGIVFKFEIKMPLLVARQWWKHHIASSFKDEQDGWNETSFRYVDISDAQIYEPVEFYQQSTSDRQAAGLVLENDEEARAVYQETVQAMREGYKKLRALGLCKQQARGIMPTATYTHVRWTVSLHALLWFIQLRNAPGAQTEIQKFAQALRDLIEPYVPETIAAFDEHGI